MNRTYFIKTDRIGFSKWKEEDILWAQILWGDPAVTRFICASGYFSRIDIENRLKKELENEANYQVQYWPIFELASDELIGCCGLRPYGEKQYEIGFHLRPAFWRQGYAAEAAKAVIHYAFDILHADGLFAGHHPQNAASARVLEKLGFVYVGDEFYAPTGLHHPSYFIKNSVPL